MFVRSVFYICTVVEDVRLTYPLVFRQTDGLAGRWTMDWTNTKVRLRHGSRTRIKIQRTLTPIFWPGQEPQDGSTEASVDWNLILPPTRNNRVKYKKVKTYFYIHLFIKKKHSLPLLVLFRLSFHSLNINIYISTPLNIFL